MSEAVCKVLVIDDDTLVRRMLCSALQKLNYIPFEACTGKDGMLEFKKVRPDIVITDVMMPDKNGFQTITELRAAQPDLKIIAMSGGGTSGGNDFFTLARELGAGATLRKPFELDDVKLVLDKVRGAL